MALQTIEEAMFTKLFSVAIEGLRDAVGVKRQRVAREKAGFADGTLPIFEQSEDGGSGFEPIHAVIAADEQRREMAAVGVAQAAGLIVVFGKEERRVGAFGGVLAEEAVDRTQETLRFLDRHGALAAQIGLKIG